MMVRFDGTEQSYCCHLKDDYFPITACSQLLFYSSYTTAICRLQFSFHLMEQFYILSIYSRIMYKFNYLLYSSYTQSFP